MQEGNQKAGLILVLNSGSSSLKFGAYSSGPDGEQTELSGSADGIGRSDGSLRIQASDGTTVVQRQSVVESQSEALAELARTIAGRLRESPAAVGHRVVHGGPHLRQHQLITPAVLDQLGAAAQLAPLHVPQALTLIRSAQSIFPSAAHYACFDDAFHQTMPEVASHLPLPQRYFDAGIRRYGFHGLSYEALVQHFGAQLPERAIFAHLGNGASLCALRNGASIDTTMGLTPTGGIPMGTRSGDLDPGVLLYLMRHQNLDANALEDLLNHQSGLFALSSGESDVKLLEQKASAGDRKAALAMDVFAVSVRKAIGSYLALLGGADLLVFTGGIGEHCGYVRSAATQGLEVLGLTQDKIRIVPAREELQIARHCRKMMSSNREDRTPEPSPGKR